MLAEKIQRINELARKSREEGLSPEELAEQAALRAEYIAAIRSNFESTLDNTYVQRPDGSKKKLVKLGKTEQPEQPEQPKRIKLH